MTTRKVQRIEQLARQLILMTLLIITCRRDNISLSGVPATKIKKLSINSARIRFSKNVSGIDISGQKNLKDLLDELLDAIVIPNIHHDEYKHGHEHIYKKRTTKKITAHMTHDPPAKVRHTDKKSVEDSAVNGLLTLFLAARPPESIDDLVSKYPNGQVISYDPKLVVKPFVKGDALCFKLDENQKLMSPHKFETSPSPLGVVIENGTVNDVLVKRDRMIIKVSIDNDKIKECFSGFIGATTLHI